MNKNNQPFFSIIIPTYNSENTIRFTLDSIKQQDIDELLYEILVIDGGSTDNTITIAKRYGVKIIHNEKKLPEYAKQIGFTEANGHYIIKMDSDESFIKPHQLSQRYNALKSNPDIHLLIADKLVYPGGYGIAGNYINRCGDPFSYYIYRFKQRVTQSFSKNIINNNNDEYCVMMFKDGDMRPIADGGTTTIDINYVKSVFDDKLKDISFVCSASDNIIDKTGKCICIKNDDILHRSKSFLKSYISKIKFRVINNVMHPDESGFSTRNVSRGYKKYLFPLYSCSLLLPIIDGIILSIQEKNITMMLHPVYCLYTTFYIAMIMLAKVFGKQKQNVSY